MDTNVYHPDHPFIHISRSVKYVSVTDIYKGAPRPRIPACVMASSAMGFKLGVFGLLSTKHAKSNTTPMHPWHFTHVYLHAQTAVDAGDKLTV